MVKKLRGGQQMPARIKNARLTAQLWPLSDRDGTDAERFGPNSVAVHTESGTSSVVAQMRALSQLTGTLRRPAASHVHSRDPEPVLSSRECGRLWVPQLFLRAILNPLARCRSLEPPS